MKLSKEYIEYLKDNPEGYWFKRKAFGWGWVPATWQGFATIAVFSAAVLLFALTLDKNSSGREVVFTFLLPFIFLTIIFFRIAYLKGEKPKWQWGMPKKETQGSSDTN
ncbi:MAG: hypothetical protein CMI56_00435 [Parcubacteria group bacterium]|nr:hypothetical protein [Parcubacteria group bacterium]|tara:strand:- start:308 stop:631 length:324 start_codon:yes stop_codon:yes gene_type:complete